MTDIYETETLNLKISTIDVIIAGLQEGLVSLEWVKQEPDTRQQELDDYLSQREALVQMLNSLE